MRDFEKEAIDLVYAYAWSHLDTTDIRRIKFDFNVFTVWKCKTLQNWKFLLSTTLHDGMYYELTYDGDRDCWYLDAYKKFDNKCIPTGR